MSANPEPRAPSVRRARRTLGDALTLRIDPILVATGTARLTPLIRSRRAAVRRLGLPRQWEQRLMRLVRETHPFVLDDTLYPDRSPISSSGKFRRLASLVEHLDAPELSAWWQEGIERLATGRTLKVKFTPFSPDGILRTRAELDRYLDAYLLPLITSIRERGYVEDLAGTPGEVTVGPRGEIEKGERATHRFIIAHLLDVRDVPVRVVFVHEDWWATSTSGRTDRQRLASAVDALRGVAEAHRR